MGAGKHLLYIKTKNLASGVPGTIPMERYHYILLRTISLYKVCSHLTQLYFSDVALTEGVENGSAKKVNGKIKIKSTITEYEIFIKFELGKKKKYISIRREKRGFTENYVGFLYPFVRNHSFCYSICTSEWRPRYVHLT
jgi:hypothetical protein